MGAAPTQRCHRLHPRGVVAWLHLPQMSCHPPPGTPVSLSPAWLCTGGIPATPSHSTATGTPGGTPGSPLRPVVPVPSPGHHSGGLRRPLRRQAHQGAAGGRAPGGERRLHGALRRPADDHRYVPCRAVPCRAVPRQHGWHRSPAGSARGRPRSRPAREAPGTGKPLAASCGCAGPDKERARGRTLTHARRPLTRCHDLPPSPHGCMGSGAKPSMPPGSFRRVGWGYRTPEGPPQPCPAASDPPAGAAAAQLARTTGTDSAGSWK